MTSYLVSPSGDDTTGNGSYGAPFKTIARAATEAAGTPVDSIEVAAGTTTEAVAITSPLGFREIRGRGAAITTIAINLSGSWISFDSVDGDRVVIRDVKVETLTNDATLVSIDATDDTAGGITFARSRLTLAGDSVVIAYVGPDPQTYEPVYTADLVHCLVEGPDDDVAGYAFSGVGSPINVLAARNCVFRRLLAVNAPSTQPVDSDGNCFFDNERDLTLGLYGASDRQNDDPLLVADTIEPSTDSPLIGAGLDLRSGFGDPERSLPDDLNLGFVGTFPTIGIIEPVAANARTLATATDIHLVVSAEASQTGAWLDDLDTVGRERSIRTASGADLARRWGALTGLRNIDGNAEEYRRDLADAITAILEHAPSWHTLRELTRIIYGTVRLKRVDDNRRYHFQAGTKLKIWADGAAPTWDFYLTAGELQLEGQWLNVRRNAFSVAHTDATHWLYVSGADPLNVDGSAKVQRSTTEITDETRTQLSGNLTFRNGETEVTASADLSALVQQHRRIVHGFSSQDYVVEEVVDERTIRLRYPYDGEDHVGLAWVITPNHVFGTVTTDDTGGVTAIDCPGRLGSTTRPYSRMTKAHGYELTLDTSGSALQSATAATRLLFEMLGRAHPTHKRGYFRLRDDTMTLVLGQPWPYEGQSAFDYSEIFDDPAWFA